MKNKHIDRIIIASCKKTPGILEAFPLRDEDRSQILRIEKDAEERSLMGLGKVVNVGVTEVLKCESVYVALTNMDFDWGPHPSIILKKGEEIVGEEVRDKAAIERLSEQGNVWFMHRNFVVYKDKLSFPQDIMKKICYFEIPCLPAQWCTTDSQDLHCELIIYANPATPTDIFLKEHYFQGIDEKGLGTILVGVVLKENESDTLKSDRMNMRQHLSSNEKFGK